MSNEEILKELDALKFTIQQNSTAAKILLEKVEELSNEIKDQKEDVPETIEYHSPVFTVNYVGDIQKSGVLWDKEDDIVKSHRIFQWKSYAKKFKDKTQIIADLLYFKWLHDRDYEPDFKSSNDKWYVKYDWGNESFEVDYARFYSDLSNVFFSKKEIAEKCADWLNKTTKIERKENDNK